MNDKISFFVLSTAGSPVKQITVSKTFIRFFGCFLAICIALSFYVFYDYLKIHTIEGKCIQQQSEIHNQQNQIQGFAEEITSLKTKIKTKVLALSKFKNQIRFINSVKNSNESEDLFVIAVSIPEDLDTRVPLIIKHNSLLQ